MKASISGVMSGADYCGNAKPLGVLGYSRALRGMPSCFAVVTLLFRSIRLSVEFM
jgi:hypothetical protein